MREAPLNQQARALWARSAVRLWPERYWLASLPPDRLGDAGALVARVSRAFAALVLEHDEVSLTIPEALWTASALRPAARAEAGPFRALTFDLDIDLAVCGYLAPAAQRLAAAGVSIVPQCAYLKDHLLVREEQASRAVEVIEQLIRDCRG